ncbi:MAG: histidine kinase [Chitinophagaceae bacterium]|nr:histidine kinase [Chitinophagaceae bacterium]
MAKEILEKTMTDMTCEWELLWKTIVCSIFFTLRRLILNKSFTIKHRIFIRKEVIILLFYICLLVPAKAQLFEEKNFNLYTTESGLSNNQVSFVTQDLYGYIWIGTKKGLNRFDGSNFLQFHSDTSRNSLPADWIFRLRWLNKEELAVVAGTGIHIINTRTLQSRNLLIPADSLTFQFALNNVQGMSGDDERNIFVITSAGFYQFNNNDQLVFRYDHYDKKQLETRWLNFGRSIGPAFSNTLLLSTIKGLYIYNKKEKVLRPINKNDEQFYRQIAKPGEWFHVMHTDKNSFSIQMEGAKELAYYDVLQKRKYIIHSSFPTVNVFDWRSKVFKLNDTLLAINGKEKGFYLIRYDQASDCYTLDPHVYFEKYFCASILPDKNKRYWIGTNKGLFREKRQTASVEKMTVPQQWNPFSRDIGIKMITITGDKIFTATDGEGMIIFNRESLTVMKKIDFSKYGDLTNHVFSTIKLDDDTILAGTYGELLWINTRNLMHGKVTLPDWDPSHFSINAMFRDSRNNIYVSRNTSNVFYRRKTGETQFKLSDHSNNDLFRIQNPMHITEDPEGNIWFSAAGISRFNYSLQQFDRLLDSFPAIKVRRKDVQSLEFDKNGKMYFSVKENGLMIYDPVQNKFQHLTRSDGLPDNNISAVYFYNNKIWLGTESGLASLDIKSGKISVFGMPDGLPADPFTASTFYFDPAHQQLYGAFNNTIVRFNPDELQKNNSPPDFFIESITIAGQGNIYHPTGKIKLSYKNNNIVVNLAAINFEDAYQQQFAYRFVKTDDEPWQEAGSQRNIIFSNLSPGEHRLQLKVYIKNNSWPEQLKEIIITIKPPFWQTAWFIILAIALILLTLYAFYKFRIKNIKQKANIDKQLAELEIKSLHAQMNPHFIFNSLNSIKEMILEDEKQNASRYLSKFAQLIRTNLEQSRQTFITVKQCIDHLQQYLEMEKIRFEGFSYTIDLDEDLPENTRMAPLLIQPLVENAIWHGLQNQAGEKKLNIRFCRSGGQLVCEIEDNGIGIHQSAKDKAGSRPSHRSLGIQNIHERLKVLNEKYNMNSSLSISDRSGLPGNKTGTIAILRCNI